MTIEDKKPESTEASPNVSVSTPSEHVRLLTLSDPETLNAMSFDLVNSLYEALEAVGRDNDCWVVILTGAGRGFCSGMNLDEVGLPPNSRDLPLSRMAMRAMETMSGLVPQMRAIPQPIVASINGPAYGGGMCLALAADVRVAGQSAVFRAAGINNGLSGVELGASFLLPRLIGASRSNELLLSGRRLCAEEAERIGLVSRVVHDDELIAASLELARQMCKHSTFGLQTTKKLLWDGLECGSLSAAVDLENRNQLLVRMLTQNLQEAIAARKESRDPVYKD